MAARIVDVPCRATGDVHTDGSNVRHVDRSIRPGTITSPAVDKPPNMIAHPDQNAQPVRARRHR